jgi:ATP-binding cassette subfamily B multidrug efflux pump
MCRVRISSFFQNDFAGRIVTKVWTAGQATGDFMVSLLQVVWFILIYTVTTMALVAQLDWRLSALVLVWVTDLRLCWRGISCRGSAAMPAPVRKPLQC